MSVSGVEAAALARNDRFLVEAVEGWSLCPFARATRLSGQLSREVLLGAPDAAQIAARVASYDETSAQIVLLIFPELAVDVHPFERLVEDARRIDARPPLYAMAPFHPATAYHDDTPSRLVGLFRRSPDPTIQLVRFSALEAAKRRAPDGKFFFDGSPQAWQSILARPERGLSEQITHDNFERVRARSADLARLLDRIRLAAETGEDA